MFDLFVRLIRVDLYVRFFCPISCPIFARFFCPTCSCPTFFRFFCPISSPIIIRFSISDFFVRLLHVRFSLSDSFVPFFYDLFCPTCSCPIFCPIFFVRFSCPILCPIYFVRRVHVRFFVWYLWVGPTCSWPIFFWFFDPISCPIFARLLSDFLCPICFIRFFCANFFVRLVHVRFLVLFSLSDSFVLFSLSDFLLYFLFHLLSHFWGWFLVKKDRACVMYCHLCHVLSMCQEFLLLWQYCITARMGVIKSHNGS